MIITLVPILKSAEPVLEVVRSGDIVSINGEAFDFSQLHEGETLPYDALDSDYFEGSVSRINDDLHLTLRLPIGQDASEAERFPEPIYVTTDGPVELPR